MSISRTSSIRSATTNLFQKDSLAEALTTLHEERRVLSTGWSLGSWARRLNLSSAAALSNLLKGRKNPSQQLLEKIISTLNLNPTESDYLRSLAEKQSLESKSLPLPICLLRKLKALRLLSETQTLPLDQLHTFSNPLLYYVAEMVLLPGFEESPERIRERLRVPAEESAILDALQALIRTGMLERTKSGKLARTNAYFDSPKAIRNESVKRFHEKSLENATKAIREVAPDSRHVTSDVVTISRSRIHEAKEMLEAFRAEFAAAFAPTQEGDEEVFQMNLQLLPITWRKE